MTHTVINGIEHKTCSGCGRTLPLIYFPSANNASDALYSQCRECVDEYARQRRAKTRANRPRQEDGDYSSHLRHWINRTCSHHDEC